ncbi:hypothetical protein [Cryptosporangium sp. NPDC051539]|uniref:hypothetical protein n=1 Tax=Cryptosporangium sp. NPDC051539 TaxID=3363962 RepID=UPI0037955020
MADDERGQRSRSKRRRGGEINALAEQLARASSAEDGRAWDTLDADERAGWIAAWQPTALSMRARRALPLSEREITTIAQTHRRIEPAGSGPPARGMTQAAQMIVDLRLRG